MITYNPLGSYSGSGYNGLTGSYYNRGAGASLSQNLNGLYSSYNAGRAFNNFGYGSGFGYGGTALGFGGGFNNTGFLIAAVLIPAITTFISAMFSGDKNSENSDSFNQCQSFDNYAQSYDSEDADENFENGFNV